MKLSCSRRLPKKTLHFYTTDHSSSGCSPPASFSTCLKHSPSLISDNPSHAWSITTKNGIKLGRGKVRQDAGKGQKVFSKHLETGLSAARSLPWHGAVSRSRLLLPGISGRILIPPQNRIIYTTYLGLQARKSPSCKQRSLRRAAFLSYESSAGLQNQSGFHLPCHC